MELRGQFSRFGVRGSAPAGYSSVMRNRATCFGAYPDIYWTEITLGSRLPNSEVPASLQGEWSGKASAAHGIAGDTGRATCLLDDQTMAGNVGIRFEGIYVSRTRAASVTASSRGLAFSANLNSAPQRQFVSFNEQTGVVVTRQVLDNTIHCLQSRREGSSLVVLEWPDMSPGALINPCETSSESEAVLSNRKPECLAGELSSRFLAGGHVMVLSRNGGAGWATSSAVLCLCAMLASLQHIRRS